MVILKLLGSKMEYNKKEQLLDKVSGLKYMNPSGQGFYHNKALDTACVHIKEFFDSEFVPEVPQYVIDWYEENKHNLDYNLWNFIMDWDEQEPSEFINWFNRSKEAFKTIVNMKQFGYKLKEEKKYSVKIKGVVTNSSTLKYNTELGKWYMGRFNEFEGVVDYHTKEELEKGGFGDVFENPLFEVKEVK